MFTCIEEKVIITAISCQDIIHSCLSLLLLHFASVVYLTKSTFGNGKKVAVIVSGTTRKHAAVLKNAMIEINIIYNNINQIEKNNNNNNKAIKDTSKVEEKANNY